jgi:hypothetical protein
MASLAASGRALALCLGLLGLSACSTASSPQEMSVSADTMAPLAPAARGYHAFRVGETTGGAATSAIGLSDISNDALRAALGTSLHNLGYLSDDGSRAAYVVGADLVDLDRPTVAFDPALLFVPIDLSVTVRVHYTVTPANGGRPLFDDVVATTGTATASDAATPSGRVRKANEAAMRLNIVAFLRRLQTDWK